MAYTLRSDYSGDPEARAAFIRFLVEVHELDLTRWAAEGFWDDGYTQFSFFDGDRVVSTVSVFTLEMIVEGRRRRVAQLSGVGTVASLRRSGLNGRLTREAMAWVADTDHAFTYLFANDEAIAYYRKRGFRPVAELKPCVRVAGQPALPGARKLDLERPADLNLVHETARLRTAVSDRLGVLGPSLLMFHALYSLTDFAYHIPALDVVVFVSRKDSRVTIHDIVGATVPPFSEIYRYLAEVGDQSVEFLFPVDKLGLDDVEWVPFPDNNTHVSGPFPLEGSRYLFPDTSRA